MCLAYISMLLSVIGATTPYYYDNRWYVSRVAGLEVDKGYCQSTYDMELEMDATSGWRACEKTSGCCYMQSSDGSRHCRPCQVPTC